MSVVDLMNQNRWSEAETALAELDRQHPLNPFVMFNQGVVYWQTGRFMASIQSYRRCLGADPTFLHAMVNLSNALVNIGDFREALRYAQMAVRKMPGNAPLLTNLATILSSLGEHADAVGALRDALRADPNSVKAKLHLIAALDELGETKEELRIAEPLAQDPGRLNRISARYIINSVARKGSRWDLLDKHLQPMLDDLSGPDTPPMNPMAFSFFSDDPALLHRLALANNLQKALAADRRPQRRDGRMTIAYMSPDFREHPVAHMLLGVLQAHDRTRVRLIAISVLPMGDSPVANAIRSCVDEVLTISHMDDSAAMHAFLQSGIDVLVDLAGSTKYSRTTLLVRRPCPAQVLWLGCPVTTGANFYDAFIVDRTVAPEGYEAYCTEPLVRLPVCYHPISTGHSDAPRQLTRQELQLPEDGFLVAMLQQPAKIRPPIVDRVAATVARYPDAHFWVRVHHEVEAEAVARFAGLGLPRERLHIVQRFTTREIYLGALAVPDVIVDTYPYGGHSTTGEALMMGAPVLTFPGRSIHSRVAASMLTQLGLGDLVQPDMDGMIGQLDRLCASADLRAEWKKRFAAAPAPYRERGIRQLVQALEDAYDSLLRSAENR